jgi:hypothetical protein
MPENKLLSALGGPVGAVTAGLGLAETIAGIIGKNKSQNKIEDLMAQRSAYQTPEEVYKILEATQQNAQTGFGATTLGYLTNQADRAFSSSVGSANLLGGDANDLAALFDQRMNESFKIAGQDQALQFANFNKFLGALNTVSDNKAAEWQSQQNIIKDQIQATAASGADANKMIGEGINAGIGSLSAAQQMKLYNQDLNTINSVDGSNPLGAGYSTSGAVIPTRRATNNYTNIIPRG